jgi:hypothetical protein
MEGNLKKELEQRGLDYESIKIESEKLKKVLQDRLSERDIELEKVQELLADLANEACVLKNEYAKLLEEAKYGDVERALLEAKVVDSSKQLEELTEREDAQMK